MDYVISFKRGFKKLYSILQIIYKGNRNLKLHNKILTPLFMLSNIDTEISSKVLSKKKVPPATANANVDVLLKTLRFNVAHKDIL